MTTKKIYYEKKNNSLIVYCDNDEYSDFFSSLESKKAEVAGKVCFIIPKEKENELIKILNYLNTSIHLQQPSKEKGIVETSSSYDDRINFFKSFGTSEFRKNLEKKRKMEKDDDEDSDHEDECKSSKKSEYSSSSYDSSSSDNFPSPRTPKKKSNYSNEQLFFMIEKLQKKVSLIEKVLEKKFLK